MYKYVLNSVVKISMMFAKYFEYYTIILRGPFFRGHAVDPVTKIDFKWPSDSDSRPRVVSPGDTINCSANGRPEPSYNWYLRIFEHFYLPRYRIQYTQTSFVIVTLVNCETAIKH